MRSEHVTMPISEIPREASTAWHVLFSSDAARQLTVDLRTGLSNDEVARCLSSHGPNAIQEHRARSPWRMLFDQFTDFMILVLIGAAIISRLIGEPPDAIAIMVIVVLNGVIGFIQEYRAERASAALKLLAAPNAKVLRDGQQTTIPASQLVPGDVVVLEAGDGVPADVRLVEAVQLKVEEAALTGESVPVDKQARPLTEVDLPLGDRLNMAYKGTLVTYGRGTGLVVATGMRTELGKIATLLREEEEVKTPLQKRLAQFGQRLALAALAICAIVFLVGVLRGESVMLMFLTAVSLAVAAIPEALPAIVTVALARGARKMVKKQALIRRLPAVETLGSVTYICSDKTGTLTQNKMQVEQVAVVGQVAAQVPRVGKEGETGRLFGQALALSNDAVRQDNDRVLGDPTEVALYVAARQAGYDKEQLQIGSPRLAELPFDSDRKCMTTLHREGDGIIAFTKGAPERVIGLCETIHDGTERMPLKKEALLDQAERMAAEGLRVLAVAFRQWPAVPSELLAEQVERDLVFLGLIGLLDPPRPEVHEAVKLCQAAGITPVMITGDHPATARAIVARLRITTNDDVVMTGQELARLPLEKFEERAKRVRVYARAAPEQKIKIVKALQDKGEFVAMTGDGVNDAPALKRAGIGVAMGVTGTDVAREASHMILLDDNFASIVSAVREGRRIFDNIRRFINTP